MAQEILYRFFGFNESDIDVEKRTVNLSFSSEDPYERSFGLEILSHDNEAVDLSRLNDGAPLLLNHDPDKQIGVIEQARVAADRKGRAMVRFSKSALGEEIFQDVRDGIRRGVSVGYYVNNMIEEEERSWRVTRWTPIEISFATIPADNTVGVGRALETPEVKNTSEEIITMAEEVRAVESPQIDVVAERDKARKEEQDRVREIYAISEKHNERELAQEYVKNGKSPAEFGMAVLEKRGQVAPIETKSGKIGMSDKDVNQFRFVRAINALAQGNLGKYAPYEKEVSDATAQKLGKQAQGFFVPDDVLHRALTVGTPASPSTGAGNMVAQELLSSSFIELIYKRMVVKQAGARTLTGLVGDILIPKMTGGAAVYWVAENTDLTAVSAQTFTQLSMRPKTLGAYSELSRKLLIQESLDVEALVRDDMAMQIALEIDKKSLMGSGAPSNIPTGILSTSGIGAVDCGGVAPDYADLINLWSDVAVENADFGSLAYVFNAKMAGCLMQRYPNGTGGDTPILVGGPQNGTIIGFRTFVTNQIPNTFTSAEASTGGALTAIVFGNFNDLIIGQWSGVDILVDPYTNSAKGTVRVVMLQDMDCEVRHAESFSATQNAATA
jgi:HK97 family phage major capsid protein